MFKYILKRLGYMAVTLFLVLTVNFLLLQLLPGSPFDGGEKDGSSNCYFRGKVWDE